MPLPPGPLQWPHGGSPRITEGRHTSEAVFSKSLSDWASPSISQCVYISPTRLLAAPQMPLALCLHILAFSANHFLFLSVSYVYIKAVLVPTPLESPSELPALPSQTKEIF